MLTVTLQAINLNNQLNPLLDALISSNHMKFQDKGLTLDLGTLLFPELYLKHERLHPQQVLKDQNLKPWLSCVCQEEYYCFSSLYE